LSINKSIKIADELIDNDVELALLLDRIGFGGKLLEKENGRYFRKKDYG